MAVLKLVTWPNPILETPADPVTKFDDDLRKLADDMFETMYAAPGVGLAAVQVGVPRAAFFDHGHAHPTTIRSSGSAANRTAR